jgi:hypothetical protein
MAGCSCQGEFLRMPGYVQALVMGRALETRQTGGDGVVAPRLDFHVVRWIGVHEMDCGAVKKAVHVFRLAAIGAEQAVLAENPQVAAPDRFRHRRWPDQSRRHSRAAR